MSEQGRYPVASVIIAAYNAARTLPAQLEALATQDDPPPFEVIVADNRSSDALADACAPFRDRLDLSVITADAAQGQSYARNVGALAARGTVLLFCDADDVVASGWVRGLYQAVAGNSAIATGPIEVFRLNDETGARAYLGGTESLIRPFEVEGYRPFVFGGNLAISRDDLIRIGGWDNSYRGGDEDVEFSWRAQEAGLVVVCVEEAILHCRLRTRARDMFHQRRRYARERVLTWVRSRETGRPLGGMSLKWTLRETLRVPFRWFTARGALARLVWARESGAIIGNLEGQVRYRLLRRTPPRAMLNDPPFADNPS